MYIKIVAMFFTVLSSMIYAKNDSFITNLEYAAMLYKNPRGIGCNKCHGKYGEGKIIAKYKQKGKIKYLKSPKINDISREKFFESFNKKHKIMPKYFLTYEEINALYFYLNSIKKRKRTKRKKR